MPNELKNNINVSQKREMDSIIKLIAYSLKHSKFYQSHLSKLQINQDNFSIEDYKKLPFTTKQDLSQFNFDFLAVDAVQVADYSTTSGTSGAPITVFSTKSDLEQLAENEAHSFELVGATSNDIFQLMTSIDKQFMAGLAYYLGAQKLNSGIIRIGPGLPSLQWKSILNYKPTIIIGVPSFILSLIDYAQNNNIHYSTCSVKKIICIGEAIRNDDFQLNALGRKITQDWKVELFSTYASTEISVAFTECEMHVGNHLNDEMLFLEVLNQDGLDVGEGEIGEIVISTLKKEAMPLIRYKTGDLARVYRKPCACGRKTARIGKIHGRLNQMIKYKGTTIFPGTIFEILDNLPNIWLYKIIIEKDHLENDKIIIFLQEEIKTTRDFNTITDECKSRLRVLPIFVFDNREAIHNMIYHKDSRKPEKILFK